jgi:hypothetical protein
MNISEERFKANFGNELTKYVMNNSHVLMCQIEFKGKKYFVGYSNEMGVFYSASYLPDEQYKTN